MLSQEKKWYKFTKNDIVILSLQVVSGVSDGFNQAILHRNFGEGNQFWDQDLSWRNKWKNGDPAQGEKFFGSSTIFVAFTDGFHSTRTGTFAPMIVSIAISSGELKSYAKKDRWKVILRKGISSYIVNRTAFELTFKNL